MRWLFLFGGRSYTLEEAKQKTDTQDHRLANDVVVRVAEEHDILLNGLLPEQRHKRRGRLVVPCSV